MCFKMVIKIQRIFSELKLSALMGAIYFLFLPFFILLYFTFSKEYMIQTPGVICLGDFISLLGDGYFFAIAIIPALCCLILMISKNNNTANYIIRHKSKRTIFAEEVAKIVVCAVVFSVYMGIVAFFIGALFSNEVMNWDSTGSYYFLSYGELSYLNFWEVMINSLGKIAINLILLSIIGLVLEIFIKKIYMFLAVIVLSAVNLFNIIPMFLIEKINLQIEFFSYNYLLAFLIYTIIIICVLIFIALKTVKKREYFNG